MKNIAVIGIGALGKRHLQSIYELDDQYAIYAVDPNINEIKPLLETDMPHVHYLSNVSELPYEIECTVIATNSNVRRQVFEELISHSHLRYIIFEKVLFQTATDYELVEKKLNEYEIKAWVNCARREWVGYKELKKELTDIKDIHFFISGGKWGIGCNGIHMLDLVEYLSGDCISNISTLGLENGLYESKRIGYVEFYGNISGNVCSGKSFNIICMKNSNLPLTIEIVTEKKRYFIEEYKNKYSVYDGSSGWIEKEFSQSFQSQMTARIIKSIIDTNHCNLPDYKSSQRIHLKYINELMKFFKKNGWEEDSCPIT